ncbi:GtrA family protein [Salinimicrobium sediminilitoris]|uniref:GtrA family protein n=1 Tax=Salinimicrobium sediminilitoris TaxID=2876715 RepID=UPI001E48E055|nr:GtrA family protein [Salinimicrobium sediminilitoris]MCC8358761.1 GtrA family protein [Salinimicrobium sediminilitoris]
MTSEPIRKIIKYFAGFAGVGGIVTLISLIGIYIFIELFQFPLLITYIGIYSATILLSYLLNSLLVFKSSLNTKKGIKYIGIYLSGMILGVAVLWIFEKILPFDDYILAYAVIPITMIWNFVLSYLLFKPSSVC